MFYIPPTGPIYNLYVNALSQPHLLVAGVTGSGKSVVINGLVSTVLHRCPGNKPGCANLILIDVKLIELNMYRDLPHTITYADDPVAALSALRTAINIVMDRYHIMQSQRIRNYEGGDIYVIIDEFADLMTTQRRAVIPLIQRLAQIGRAARVHIVLATQTPIAKVLPTEIKCNFDSRIGLRTRSAQDSRNIIGQSGLETLPKHGQGYYMTPDGEDYYQIPKVPEEEISRIIDWWSGNRCKRA